MRGHCVWSCIIVTIVTIHSEHSVKQLPSTAETPQYFLTPLRSSLHHSSKRKGVRTMYPLCILARSGNAVPLYTVRP